MTPTPRPPTDVRRRARRAVAGGAALFVGLQLAFGVASEACPRIRDPFYGDKLVKLRHRLADAGPGPRVVVMLGSSRTGMAFHAGSAEELVGRDRVVAFNFGVPAAGPVVQLVYFERLLRDGVTPDLLLVEVLPSMLAERPGGRPHEAALLFADRLDRAECGTVARHGFPATATRGRWARSVALPAYWLRFQTMTRLLPSSLPWHVRHDWSRGADADGLSRTAAQTIDAPARAKMTEQARREYAPLLADYTPGGPAVAALEELLSLCSRRGIAVRLVLMPEATDFRAHLPAAGYARLLDALDRLEDRHGTPVVNAREWLPDDAFYDGHHTFVAGADAFTERLTREAIAPFLDAHPTVPTLKAGR